MASLFKRPGRDCWIIQYFDHNGKRWEKSSRTTDKKTAQRIADKLGADAALRREGVINPELDDYATHGRRPIAQHVADYRKHLEANRAESHANTQRGRIEKIIAQGRIGVWAEVTPDKIDRTLQNLKAEREFTEATLNAYLTAFKGFCNWMVKRRRAERNPIASLERATVEHSEARRAMTEDEARRLLSAAEAGPVIRWRTRAGADYLRKHGEDMPGGVRCEWTGPERALLYRFAIETGQRRSAIERLTVADFYLSDQPGQSSVTFKAKANTKSRSAVTIPLRDETAAMLADAFMGKLPASPAFNMPKVDETADMIRADLSAARAAWIAEGGTAEERAERAGSAFLAEVDAEERRVDFHALRTTCASWLNHAGVADSIAQRITGHTQVTTLRKHYQRAGVDQVRQAVEAMPTLRSTGTDAVMSLPHRQHGRQDHQHHQQKRQQLGCVQVQPDAAACEPARPDDEMREARKPLVSNKKPRQACAGQGFRVSEGDGARTRNLRIDSPML